ncbi:MAG: hypothetical protein ACKO8I_05405 [Cyanobacteriota bacterium]
MTQDPPCSRAARQGPATTQWRSAAEPNVQLGWLVKPLPRRGAWKGLRHRPESAAESHRASLSFPSDNGKTGPIAVSSTSRRTCPSSCTLAGDQGCYAEAGFHTRLHWDRLSRGESGLPAAAFIKQVLALPAGILFCHCVAGDQWPDPADPLRIDQALMLQLARASRHLRAAWSFTHFPMGSENQAAVRQAAAKGLVINASTESRSVAARLQRQGIAAVCVVPPDAPAVFRHEGVRFVACPASRHPLNRQYYQQINQKVIKLLLPKNQVL